MGIINQYSKKVKELLKRDNSFLLADIDLKNKSYSYDTVWCGFGDKCELREARLQKLTHLSELELMGYGIIVHDKKSFLKWIKLGAGKAIFHRKTIEKTFPSLLKPQKSISSAKYGGFFSPSSAEGAKLKRRKANKTEKREIFSKRGATCHICKGSKDITMHHLLPRAFGGGTEIDNLIPLCRDCHDEVHGDPKKLQNLMSLRFQQLFDNFCSKRQKA